MHFVREGWLMYFPPTEVAYVLPPRSQVFSGCSMSFPPGEVQTQPWYPTLLEVSIQNPILLTMHNGILRDPVRNTHPLVENESLQLGAWLISGQTRKTRNFQQGLQTLSQKPDQSRHELITTQPGRNLVAGVVNRKLIQFTAL